MTLMQRPKVVLASASSARHQLLKSIGVEPVVHQSNFDESQIQISDYAELVKTLAYRKAKIVAEQLQESALVLGCDSLLALAGEVYGKPTDAAEAILRWQSMRGQSGDLCTGHALIDLYQNQTLVRVQITKVYFANLSDRQIQAYVATGEPLHCAGGFALDGKGGLFVEKIEGCPSNVIGLSLPLLRQMLSELGYSITDFWAI
jgi:septum formation protein